MSSCSHRLIGRPCTAFWRPRPAGPRNRITTLDQSRNENSHRWPHFLPDGRHLLYTARSDVISNTGVYSMELGSDQRQWLVEAQSLARYVHRATFCSPERERFSHRPLTSVQRGCPVRLFPLPFPSITIPSARLRRSRCLPTVRCSPIVEASARRLNWCGSIAPACGKGRSVEESDWQEIKLSPDGSRAALVTTDRASGSRDIWLVEIATGRLQRWSTHPANDWHPVWSPDGHDLAFASDRNGASAVFRRAVDSSGEDNLIAAAAGPAAGRFPEDWSSGDHLVINQDTPNATTEIWLTTASGTGEPRLLKRAGRQTGGGRISPNGRWLAYVSNESGAFEVYVSPLNGSSKQTRLDGRRRPSAMARGRERAAVHRRRSSVDVCFRRVRRHLQGRIT